MEFHFLSPGWKKGRFTESLKLQLWWMFFEKYPLIELRENSNFNGLGWAVTSVLFYLSLLTISLLFIKKQGSDSILYEFVCTHFQCDQLIKRVKSVFCWVCLYWIFWALYHLFPYSICQLILIFPFSWSKSSNFRKHFPKYYFFSYYARLPVDFGVVSFRKLYLGRICNDAWLFRSSYSLHVPCCFWVWSIPHDQNRWEGPRFLYFAGYLTLGIVPHFRFFDFWESVANYPINTIISTIWQFGGELSIPYALCDQAPRSLWGENR